MIRPAPSKPLAATTALCLLLWIACSLAVYAVLQDRAPLIEDLDALYHYRVAELIRAHGPWIDISWLPFTVLGDRGPDHHWLFHLLIAPLTAFGHDERGLDIASAVVAGAVPAALYPLLRWAAVPRAPLFAALALFCTTALPFRFAGLRAQALALVFMFAAMFAMARRRALLAAVVAFLFTESYHGAVILGLILAATWCGQWACRERPSFELLPAVAVGVFAGLLLSPWFPRNISYLIFHTVFKTGSDDVFLVGIEWLKPPARLFWGASALAHATLLAGAATLLWKRARGEAPGPRPDTVTALILTAVFFAMNWRSWRFVEYYAPFAVVTAGLLLRDSGLAAGPGRIAGRAVAATLSAALAVGAWTGLDSLREGTGETFGAFSGFMRYVEAHDASPMVFNTFWSDFQQMVFWSDRARFVAGLDGNYLRFGDPARFGLWYDFSKGRRLDRTDNAQEIARAFGARWIVVSRLQPQLADNLYQDPHAELVMARPDSGWLFRVRP